MKNGLKRALTAARRWIAAYQVDSLERSLRATVETLPYVRDRDTREHMRLSIRVMSKELCRLRAHYQSLLPAGERRVWELA